MSSTKNLHIALGVALAVTVAVAYTLRSMQQKKKKIIRGAAAKDTAPPTPLMIPNDENRLDSGIASPKDTPTAESRSMSRHEDFDGDFTPNESFSAVCHVADKFETSSMFVETSIMSDSSEERPASSEPIEITEDLVKKDESLLDHGDSPEVTIICDDIVPDVADFQSATPQQQEFEEIHNLQNSKVPIVPNGLPEPIAVSTPIAKQVENAEVAESELNGKTAKRKSKGKVRSADETVDAKPASERNTEVIHQNNNDNATVNSNDVPTSTSNSRRQSTESSEIVHESTKSDASGDSGKGESETGLPVIPYKHEFDLPQGLCGRLIGKSGATVQSIRSTTGATVSVREHPTNYLLKTVYVVGKEAQVKHALEVIKQKFPRKHYPDVNFDGRSDMFPRYQQLSTTSETLVKVTALQSPVSFSFQLPHLKTMSYETFQANLSGRYLGQDFTQYTSLTREQAKKGVVCVAIFEDACYRVEILLAEGDECLVKFLDTGGDSAVHLGCLVPIAPEFLAQPLYAIEADLSSVEPLHGEWTQTAFDVTSQFVRAKQIYASVAGMAKNKYYVHLYRNVDNRRISLADELIAAREAVRSTVKKNAPTFSSLDFPQLNADTQQ